jgi:uncharacterized protein (TIGR00730 family)
MAGRMPALGAIEFYNRGMNQRLKSVCVFCGSAVGKRAEYGEAAGAFGRMLAERGIRLVYGAGNVGLMGVVADAALAAGGEVIGVIPQMLVDRELAHPGTDLRIVTSMHERKALMAELAEAFVALPGGLGTYEELFEVLTWGQLGIHAKPVGCLNVAGYFEPLARMVEHAVEEGFLRREQRGLLVMEDGGERLLERLEKRMRESGGEWEGREVI